MIVIRILTPDDWPAWRELRLAALADSPRAFGSTLADWQGDRDREDRWRARLSIPGSRNLLAVLNGRPAGMATGLPDPAGHGAELISMWVAPRARGRRVGDCLVQAVERWARQTGAETLRLAVRPDNERAIALYRRNGFEPTGEPGGPVDGGPEHETVMAKPLS